MKREFHVRFCERLEGETPSCLLSVKKSASILAYLTLSLSPTQYHGLHGTLVCGTPALVLDFGA